MENILFCAICGSKKESVKEFDSGVCPDCGKETYFVGNLTYWVSVEKSNGDHGFFMILTNRGGQSWVEIYKGEKEYNKLVNALSLQKDVEIIKNEYETLNYIRDGHKFQIMLIRYVDYLLAQYDSWDGNPYIEFAFVKKDHPDFEIYKKELSRLCSILDN